jgi:apolipoprotein N-acyltransferase
MAVLGIILAFLQVADGVLTGLGMAHYGTAMEGNILLRELMLLIGFVPALVVVKTAAIGVVTGLCLYAYSVTWLRSAFKVVIGLYVLLAVLPWSVILATEYFA